MIYEVYNNETAIPAWVLYEDLKITSYGTYKKMCVRGKLKRVREGKGQDNYALVSFNCLPERFKKPVVDKYGEPNTSGIRFIDVLIEDIEAKDFFNTYTYKKENNPTFLPEQAKKVYINQASIFKTFDEIIKKTRLRRQLLGGRMSDVFSNLAVAVANLPETWVHNLPTNARSLQNKYKKFNTEGYESLIHGKFGNKDSEKITEESKFWIIQRWADRVNKCATFAQLFNEYNHMAEANGWKILKSDETLKLFLNREDIKPMWWGYRYGELKLKEKFMLQLSTKLPTVRDSLWYSDGTKLNYFYIGTNGKVETCQVYEVIDAYSEVLLGYHISTSENYEAQYAAYKMAVQTSGHRPYQIVFDNQGGHKKLESGNFLSRIAHISNNSQPYNGKSKTIENIFSRLQQNHLKKDWFFTGQNITAKKTESKANQEFILANKANLPTLEEVKAVYAKRRNEWNNAPHPQSGQTRIGMYYSSNNPKAPAVDIFDMVNMFWIERPDTVKLNAYGLTFTDSKVKYTYIVYDENGEPDIEWIARNIDKKFTIKYDPEDRSSIYLYERTPKGDLRFITEARTKVVIHRGFQEQEDWEAEFRAKVEAKIKELRFKLRNETEAILKEHGTDAESYGLNNPNLKGLESSKRGRKRKAITTDTDDFGAVQKAESNLTLIDLL